MTDEDFIENIKEDQVHNAAYDATDNEVSDSIYQLQLDIDKQLSQLENKLKGYNYDPYTQKYVKENSKGLPDEVVNNIMVQLRLRVNTNTILSFIPKIDHIDEDTIDFGMEIKNLIFAAACRHDTINRQELAGIVYGIIDIFRKCNLRALEGKTMKNMAPNVKTLESRRGKAEKDIKSF